MPVGPSFFTDQTSLPSFLSFVFYALLLPRRRVSFGYVRFSVTIIHLDSSQIDPLCRDTSSIFKRLNDHSIRNPALEYYSGIAWSVLIFVSLNL